MIGTTLSHYRITEKLGQGGMGEVYRAEDTNLHRHVAIKVLPDEFSHDAERLARFQREAQVLASLSHPNIATLYGLEEFDGKRFIVMELVEGQTLAHRLLKGPLPMEEALDICRQIAEGLEAAHEKGVIHRDLKPGNVMITANDKVKILDFGLAKAFSGDSRPPDATHSPTITEAMTRPGVILGTAAYMSPEQARGKPVDKRSDIWAFGCILFECLAGKRAFEGANITETLAAILKEDPDVSALPAETPRRIRALIERCLRKEPRRRLHEAADARIEIEDAFDTKEAETGAASVRPAKSVIPAVVLSLVAGAVLASASCWLLSGPPASAPSPVRLALPLVPGVPGIMEIRGPAFSISPDGRTIVYAAKRGQRHQLFLRAMDQLEAKPLAGTDGATTPFFSPDGRYVGFFVFPDNQMKKIALSGGSSTLICSCSGVDPEGASWGTDNRIRFVPEFGSSIQVVSADGGIPEVLLAPDVKQDRYIYAWPHVLPDGKGLIFSAASGSTTTFDDAGIFILESPSQEPRLLIRGGNRPQYLPTGHLLYERAGTLLAAPFSLSQLRITDTPVTVLEGIAAEPNGGRAHFAISANGTLVYEPGAAIRGTHKLVSVDRKGEVHSVYDPANFYSEGSLSSTGRIAMRIAATHDDVWTFDVAQHSLIRFTLEPGDEFYPLWNPDASRIAYGWRVGGVQHIWWQKADGSAAAELLTQGKFARYPGSFSPDGKSLAFVENNPERQQDIWLMSLGGDRKAEPFQATAADEFAPEYSPGGSWILYASNETGSNEVYVRPVGNAGGRRKISMSGGTLPFWSRDGRELYWVNGDKMMAASFNEKTGEYSAPNLLFEIPSLERSHVYGLTRDGNQFLMSVFQRNPSPTHYQVVEHWFEELKRLVPPDGR